MSQCAWADSALLVIVPLLNGLGSQHSCHATAGRTSTVAPSQELKSSYRGGAGMRFGVAYNVVITLGLYQLCTCGLLGAHNSPGPVVRCAAPQSPVLCSLLNAKDEHSSYLFSLPVISFASPLFANVRHCIESVWRCAHLIATDLF